MRQIERIGLMQTVERVDGRTGGDAVCGLAHLVASPCTSKS